MNHRRITPGRIRFASAAFLLVLSPVPVFTADTFVEAAQALTAKISATVGPLEKVELTFRNLTSLEPAEIETARKALEREFGSRGIRIAREPDVTARIVITISENPQSYLWIAEIQMVQGRRLVMAAQERSPKGPPADLSPRMAIQMKLLIERNEPILDLVVMSEELLALGPDSLELYRRQNDRWELRHTAALPKSRALPRDARGRLTVSGDAFEAYLAGLHCNGRTGPPIAVDCANQDAPWPLEHGPAVLSPERNFFNNGDAAPFFSVAGIREEGAQLWIFAGVDGQARLYDAAMKQVGTIGAWGSDIAGIDTGCGAGRQILAALPTDPSGSGAVQLFDLVSRRAVAVSSPMEFPGPITALWQAAASNMAIAVSRDIRTGRYAAFYLSTYCGR